VLKSTGSAFEGFWKDEYTTLVPVNDRIFSTSVDLSYNFKSVKLVSPQDDKKLEFQVPLKKGDEGYEGSVWDEDVPTRARDATLQVFAIDESASVQVGFRAFLVFGCADDDASGDPIQDGAEDHR
jgi:urate oxidase